jgi:ABC-type Fe3+ transport system substrate-binding protein
MPQPTNEGQRLTLIGKLVVFLFFAGCIGGAAYWFLRKPVAGGGTPASDRPTSPEAVNPPAKPPVSIGIAYGTEKRAWLTWAVEQFATSPAGAGIRVELIPMGSVEGAQAVLRGDDKAKNIHVWSPASAIYRPILTDEWALKHPGADPIAKAEFLAFTPMVWVMWEERYKAFVASQRELSFRAIANALSKSNGSWQAIRGLTDEQQKAQQPWGFLKYGHTNPAESNSGLMTLILQGYDFAQKTSGLTLGDVSNPDYLAWSKPLMKAAVASSNSTGNLMREMVQRGPSSFDVLFVYESTVIEMIPAAEGRWEPFRVVYPDRNLWNDNPYYVLNVPWSAPEQREAAGKFLDYLMSEPAQVRALELGFRPANVQVPVKGPDSPFTKFASYGLKIDLPTMCEAPEPRVITELQVLWQRK